MTLWMGKWGYNPTYHGFNSVYLCFVGPTLYVAYDAECLGRNCLGRSFLLAESSTWGWHFEYLVTNM